MKLSARNMLKGKVMDVKLGAVMASVKLEVGGGNQITALISVDSVKALKLAKGDKAVAIIKATEVIIGK